MQRPFTSSQFISDMTSFFSSKFTGITNLLRQIYTLVRPYGRRRLAKVFLISLLQAFAQVISIAAIFPFLALAADPSQFDQSRVGQWVGSLLPGMSHEQLLITAGIALIVALFAANGASLFGEFYRARFTWGFAHWLRMRMLHRMSSRPYGWFLQQNSSILIKKANQDIMQFINGVLSPIIDGSSRLLITVLLLATIVVAEPKIAFLFGLVLGITYLLIFVWLGRFRVYLSNTLKICWREMFRHVGQFLSGIKPVKVHGVAPEFLRRVEEHSWKQSRLQAWMPVIGNGPRYIVEPLIAAVMILVVLQSFVRGQDLAALVPSLGLIAMAGYRLLPAVQMLYSQLSGIQSMRYALEEVYDEFREVEEEDKLEPNASLVTTTSGTGNSKSMPPNTFQFQTEIALEGVSFVYPASKQAVIQNLSLVIPKNTSVAFIGETGSGKSTLVDLILGLHQPTSGQILIDGQPFDTEQKIRAWQNLIGYVPQDIFLTDDTIARNIAFGIPDEQRDDARVREVVAMAQLQSFIEKELPEGYNTEVGERGVRLSGGQRQRIALARALYHHPQVLILDEATSALDNETEKRFMDVIYALADELTILMVAHRLTTVESAELQLKLHKGKFIDFYEVAS